MLQPDSLNILISNYDLERVTSGYSSVFNYNFDISIKHSMQVFVWFSIVGFEQNINVYYCYPVDNCNDDGKPVDPKLGLFLRFPGKHHVSASFGPLGGAFWPREAQLTIYNLAGELLKCIKPKL